MMISEHGADVGDAWLRRRLPAPHCIAQVGEAAEDQPVDIADDGVARTTKAQVIFDLGLQVTIGFVGVHPQNY